MKKTMLLLLLVLATAATFAQSVYNLEADTVRVKKRGTGNAVLDILGRAQSTGTVKPGTDTTTYKQGLAIVGGKLWLGNGSYFTDVSDNASISALLNSKTDTSKTKSDSSYLKGLIDLRELISRKVTTITSPNSTDYPTTGAVNGFVYSLTVGKLNASDTAAMLLPYRNQINKNTDSITALKTQVTNNTTAIAGKTDTSKSRSDSSTISQNAHQKLKSWSNKIVQIRNAKTSGTKKTTANIASVWDSVKDDFTYTLFNPIFNALGYGGQDGAFSQQGLSPNFYGTANQVGVPVLITSLTRSGTTATATSAGHGLTNGTTVTISGASNSAYNITTTISNVTTNTFDYTVSGSPATPDPSTQIYFTVAANFNKWVTGSYINISSTGGYGIVRNIQGTQLTDTPTIAKAYYLKENGAGTFKLQASADNITWTDVSGYTSISAANASGSDSLGIVSAPFTGGITPFLRVYGVSGTVKIIGLGFANPSGGKISNLLGAGGLALADMATTPEQIVGAYLLDFQPDVITFMGKDGNGDNVVAAYQTWQQRIYKYAPQCATIWGSVYESADTTGLTTQNIKMKRWFDTTTLAGERYWIDANNYIGKWSDAAFKGLYDGGAPINISSISYSGSTLSVTTATAHGLSYPLTFRINGVSPFGYDNVYIVQTAPTSTTLTATRVNTSITPSAATGSGGALNKVDGTHLSNSGRLLLGNAFNRDFNLLTGNNTNYPFLITAPALDSTGVYFKTGGTITGAVSITNTNDYNASSPSLSTLGGIAAAKDINTNTTVRAADFAASGNTGFISTSPNPYLYFNKSNATTNQKGWSISANRDGFLDFSINNDDNSLNNRWLTVTRSGTTATAATLAPPLIMSSTPTISTFTTGSIPYVSTSGLLAQNNSTFYWNAANSYLAIGHNNPSARLHVQQSMTSGNQVIVENPSTSGNLANAAIEFRGYNGSSSTTQGVLYTTNNSWSYDQSGANTTILVGVGSGGTAIASTSSSNGINFFTGTTGLTTTNRQMRVFPNGNILMQTGGTYTDNGNKLQVTGKASISAELTTAGNIIALSTKTTAYTATATDEVILADATSGAFSVTLPTAVGRSGQRYVIKKTDVSANAVTVATTSSQTIDGSTTYSLATQYKFVTVVSNGSNWMVTGNN